MLAHVFNFRVQRVKHPRTMKIVRVNFNVSARFQFSSAKVQIKMLICKLFGKIFLQYVRKLQKNKLF